MVGRCTTLTHHHHHHHHHQHHLLCDHDAKWVEQKQYLLRANQEFREKLEVRECTAVLLSPGGDGGNNLTSRRKACIQ
ncbi:hypothetical protein CRUP_036014 [Coryphaenoides rupestris]|nr:hypothetical protein CRUP_036014 [Coryphaenoides rupestris]